MAHETGGISVGERIGRLEDDNGALWRAVETQGEEMNKIKIELAKSSVRIALIVGVLSALGGGLVSWAARHLP